MGEQYPYPIMPAKKEIIDFAREHPYATLALAGVASVAGWIAGTRLADTIVQSSIFNLPESMTSPTVPGL